MSWNTIAGSWKQYRGKAWQHWDRIRDDEAYLVGGRCRELEGQPKEKVGAYPEKAEQGEERCREAGG